MTALTLYMTTTAATTVTTADTLLENATTGAALTNKNTNLTSGTTGWIEILSQGGTFGAGVGSEPAPDDKGWIDDQTTLETNHYIAGNWQFSLGFETTTTGTYTADIHYRVYQRTSGGTKTLIAEATASAQGIISTSFTVVTVSVSAAASATFATGDKTYADCIHNITVNGTTGNMRMQASSSATVGNVNAQIVTPGYTSTVITNNTMASTDTLTISDAMLIANQLIPLEAISLVENFATARSYFALETPPFTEQFLMTASTFPVDGLVPLDTLFSSVNLLPVEALPLVESMFSALAYAPLEVLTIAERATLSDSWSSVDVAPASDLF